MTSPLPKLLPQGRSEEEWNWSGARGGPMARAISQMGKEEISD